MKILILQNSLHPKFTYFQLLRTFIIINNTQKQKKHCPICTIDNVL